MKGAVAIVDDDDECREACGRVLAPLGRVVVPFATAKKALAYPALPPVTLVDMHLPGESAGATIAALRDRTLVVAITAHTRDEFVFEAIRAGAVGYVLKAELFDQLAQVLETVEAGGSPITPSIARRVLEAFPSRSKETALSHREHEILVRFAAGDGYDQAADALDISVDTVRTHVRRMYAKLRVKSRTEAVVAGLRRGLLR